MTRVPGLLNVINGLLDIAIRFNFRASTELWNERCAQKMAEFVNTG